MKKILFLFLLALFIAGCSINQEAVQQNTQTNLAVENNNTEVDQPEEVTQGELKKIVNDLPEDHFTDNGDGTVTDQITGLMWTQDPGDKVSYQQAIDGVDGFELDGYKDWRVPTIKELYSLIDFKGTDPDPQGQSTVDLVPFIDESVFNFSYGDPSAGERVIDSQWVTSNIYVSTVMDSQECFFGVNFADGRIKCYPTQRTNSQGYFAIYVRGEKDYGVNDFLDNQDGTITDQSTGLMWAQDDSQKTLNWQEAIDYCDDLELAGYSDWALPQAKELQYIVDYTRSPDTTNSPAIDPIFNSTQITNEDGQEDYGFYWTTATHLRYPNNSENGAYVSFGRALGYINGQWMDVHGAGAQRSDPKVGDPDDYPTGQGPQGDARRIYNYARCVR